MNTRKIRKEVAAGSYLYDRAVEYGMEYGRFCAIQGLEGRSKAIGRNRSRLFRKMLWYVRKYRERERPWKR